jgi:drug/metabolite transporter (DMT)-like permease
MRVFHIFSDQFTELESPPEALPAPGVTSKSASSAPAPHHVFSPRDLLLLAVLTIVWGVNWPIMKLGVTGFPPLAFRALSMWLGLPVLWAVLRVQGIGFTIHSRDWRELGKLSLTNMIVWHVLAILAVQALSSGRAAILGYTMPIFSALWGVAVFGDRLRPRHVAGVVAAAIGVALLLWHEFDTISGRPLAAIGMLTAAVVWALGTQQMRRTKIEAPTLAIVFWMTLLTTLVMTVATIAFERDRWAVPNATTMAAIAYNAVLIFGFAQPIWLILARSLPPVASSMSVMLIPVLGTISGAWWLNEKLHWQDGAAIVLVLVAIASVMLPGRAQRK